MVSLGSTHLCVLSVTRPEKRTGEARTLGPRAKTFFLVST